jgi:TolB-like protein/tRNA A-37 threonylcarbamoyl transferase component Bud32
MVSEHFASIARALDGRYRLERLLQTGVAAHVYLAEERALGRRVAVKVLRDEMTATVNAARFMSEIHVVRELRHPNIVPMIDSGDVDGVPYYVMPFIEGETLRARLARLGRLPLGETLRFSEDIARALHFAHRHRVVHRDIKPENVMINGDRALVLDFGIALAVDMVDAPRRTLPGLTLGTFHYMSPEQLDGETQIDGRSDIYSLGCVVYEMLCGRPPFTGSPNVVIRRHVSERPRPLTSMCRGVPPKIDAAVSRALQKLPDDRYASAGEFMAALAAGAYRARVIGRRVAVIPFVHLCEKPVVDTFSDGVGEEIAGVLREFDGLVIAPNTPRTAASVAGSVTGIARCVGADVLLFGDVRRSADEASVLITASLFDGRSGRRLWSGASAARRRNDLQKATSPACEIAWAVANALSITRLVDRIDNRASEAQAHGERTA